MRCKCSSTSDVHSSVEPSALAISRSDGRQGQDLFTRSISRLAACPRVHGNFSGPFELDWSVFPCLLSLNSAKHMELLLCPQYQVMRMQIQLGPKEWGERQLPVGDGP